MGLASPNETGATCDGARLSYLSCDTTLVARLKEINSIAPPTWSREGWRLLDEWQRSGDPKHLQAFNRHVTGIHARMTRTLLLPEK